MVVEILEIEHQFEDGCCSIRFLIAFYNRFSTSGYQYIGYTYVWWPKLLPEKNNNLKYLNLQVVVLVDLKIKYFFRSRFNFCIQNYMNNCSIQRECFDSWIYTFNQFTRLNYYHISLDRIKKLHWERSIVF